MAGFRVSRRPGTTEKDFLNCQGGRKMLCGSRFADFEKTYIALREGET